MGLREDLKRFKEVGEERRQDLSDYIQHGEIESGDSAKIPIKIVELPEFDYDQWDMGGVGRGDGEVGDPVDMDAPGKGEESGEPGDDSSKHGYYEMDPEEFAEELDEELGLDLDPKGKKVKEEVEGHLVELARSGPESTLDFDRLYKEGLKRTMAMYFDEEYMKEVLKVSGIGPSKAYEWARENGVTVPEGWLQREYDKLSDDEKSIYEDVEDIDRELRRTPRGRDIDTVHMRSEDKRHKYPEITEEYEKNAVIVFIRDVSGSMGKTKRELVERVFTPLDWYLAGKYDHAEFIYIAHDSEAWEVERDDFFGIESGGGTTISSAYKLAKELLDGTYPFKEWNRYIFASGDGENSPNDTSDNVIPLMEEIDVNLHGYLEVQPDSGNLSWGYGEHADMLEEYPFDEDDSVAVARVESRDDIMGAIETILSREDNDD